MPLVRRSLLILPARFSPQVCVFFLFSRGPIWLGFIFSARKVQKFRWTPAKGGSIKEIWACDDGRRDNFRGRTPLFQVWQCNKGTMQLAKEAGSLMNSDVYFLPELEFLFDIVNFCFVLLGVFVLLLLLFPFAVVLLDVREDPPELLLHPERKSVSTTIWVERET